ncbi:MAG: ATP-binding cassette domain-containing protein [Chamaesiphon sp.]
MSPMRANADIDTQKLVLQVEGLHKRYGKFSAVRGIDFAVHQGEIFGLIGPDGAGKTTTFHILAGVMEATAGNVRVLSQLPRNARLSIGYLTQQFSLYLDLSIDENIRYSAGLREVPIDLLQERKYRYLRLMGLEQFGNRLAGKLSGGMKQKLALCCALVSQPQILLLDEPTTGVDPVSRREFWDVLATLASQGVTIVVATPYLDEAERCHRIALMYEGQIQQIGTLKELRASLGLQRLEVRTPDLAAAERILLTATIASDRKVETAIADVQTFGDRLDVLVTDAQSGESEVRRLLGKENLPLDTIQSAEATLENVFVTRLRQQGSEPAFIAFPRYYNNSHTSQEIAIGASDLKKAFLDFQAVKNINLEIFYGDIYGLLGANGAGKTTAIKMLCGLLEPSSGKISLAGQTRNLRSHELRRQIGYMSQKFTLYDDLTVVQNLEFYCGVYGVPRRLRRAKIEWVLVTCGLVDREHLLTGQLPGGWKQRVAFGASVMHEPKILFLDEPTSGVDPVARRQFWRLINDFARQGTAVLVTTHYLEEAEQCNRMGFMVAGKIVTQGSPSQIKAEQPGQLIELITDRTQETSDLLKTKFEPWRVSIFGDRLHVVLNDPQVEILPLRSILQDAQLEIHSLRPIPFSLEDAFIGIVQRTQLN